MLLSCLILIPFFVSCLLLALSRCKFLIERDAGRVGCLCLIVVTLIQQFVCIFVLLSCFDRGNALMQFVEDYSIFSQWLESTVNMRYTLGVDGISVYFVVLSIVLLPLCMVMSYKRSRSLGISSGITKDWIVLSALFLMIESFVVMIFASTNILLFYIAFEAVLIPMFIIIGIWGGKDRVQAAFKLFIYTLFGSLFMLIAVIIMVSQYGESHILALYELVQSMGSSLSIFIWMCLFVAFAVKVPMVCFHTWLPSAHVQAPTGGSVILAAILLKVGGYGFLRFSLKLFPSISQQFAPAVLILSVVAVIYASFVALSQSNMKKMIAYSSIAHMGYVTAGIFCMTQDGINGAIIQMLGHGLTSAGLFSVIGAVHSRSNSFEIADNAGLATKMPRLALYFMVFMLSSVGLPGTAGFIGEIMVLFALFDYSRIMAVLLSSGIMLSLFYMVPLYRKVMFGEIHQKLHDIVDINILQSVAFFVLSVAILMIGFYPRFITSFTTSSVINLLH